MNKGFVRTIFKSVALGLGVATFVLCVLKQIEIESAVNLLALGLTCLAVSQLQEK